MEKKTGKTTVALTNLRIITEDENGNEIKSRPLTEKEAEKFSEMLMDILEDDRAADFMTETVEEMEKGQVYFDWGIQIKAAK
jgi:hypothetical protein